MQSNKVHTLIVGTGLAGVHYALQLHQNNKEFILFNNNKAPGASQKAAGILNPTVLKRYTLTWQGTSFLQFAIDKYTQYEQEWNVQLFHPLPLLRFFTNDAEHNHWSLAAQGDNLKPYLNPDIHWDIPHGIHRNSGYGRVHEVGKLNISQFFTSFEEKFSKSSIQNEVFDYTALQITEKGVAYQGIKADQIVFCEGYGITQNPWFKALPLTGSKGEFLEVKIPGLTPHYIFKGGHFIAPLYEDVFWVGATFNPNDKTTHPTQEGKDELIKKLENLIELPYQILNHQAGIRPTVIDRRPLVGTHPQCKRLHVLNGLGTRGGIMAPLLAAQLFDWITQGKELAKEIDIQRFESYFCNPIG